MKNKRRRPRIKPTEMMPIVTITVGSKVKIKKHAVSHALKTGRVVDIIIGAHGSETFRVAFINGARYVIARFDRSELEPVFVPHPNAVTQEQNELQRQCYIMPGGVLVPVDLADRRSIRSRYTTQTIVGN